MASMRLHGRTAAPGVACGKVHFIHRGKASERKSRGVDLELQTLESAISRAITELQELIAKSSATAQDILEFQRALLCDPSLLEQIRALIREGLSAATAWRNILQAETDLFDGSADPHFSARVADYRDIENHVSLLLNGIDRNPDIAAGSVIVGEDLFPSEFLGIDWSGGGAIALAAGSEHGHLALLARSLNIPMLVGVRGLEQCEPGLLIVDADAGYVLVAPQDGDIKNITESQPRQVNRIVAKRHESDACRTEDGTRIGIFANISHLSEIDRISSSEVDGVALVRTEFLFGSHGLPSEDLQLQAYGRLLEWASGKPVSIRTLDVGGDKPADAGAHADSTSQAARGIRRALHEGTGLRGQLRALLRAAAMGNVRILLPMVTFPEELHQVRKMISSELEKLDSAGTDARSAELGMMVEVPAAAMTIESFDADFYAIGTNDLSSYLLAIERNSDFPRTYGNQVHPALLELMRRVVAEGKIRSRPVTLCGDLAADNAHLQVLLANGIRAVSVPVNQVQSTINAVRKTRLHQSTEF